MKKYNNLLGAFLSGDDGKGGYNAAYQKGALAKLYSGEVAPEQENEVLSGLARVNPDAVVQWKERQAKASQENLERKSRMLASAPQVYRPQIYASMLPEVRKMWAEAPEQYTPELDQMITSWAGGGQGKYTGAPIVVKTPQGPRYARYSESGIDLTEHAPDDRYLMVKDDFGNISGFNSRENVLNPTSAGQLPQGGMPQVPQGDDPMASGLKRLNETVQMLKANGVPVDRINAIADAEFAKLQQSVQGGVIEQPPQARIGVKPEAPKARNRAMSQNEILEAGLPAGTSAQINEATGEINVLNKPPVQTEAQANAASVKARGAAEMSRVLKTMLDEYKSLDEAGGITNTDKGLLDNFGAYARASDTGQYFGRMAGSKDQSARDTINAMKPQVLSAIIAASGMSAKQLDSNAEMKLWLSATSDPQTSYQTVVKVTDNLLKKFTGKGIEQFDERASAPKKQAPKVGDVIKGYRFKGGNPANPNAWEKI